MFLRASVLVATAVTLGAVLTGCGDDDTRSPAKASDEKPAASASAAPSEKPAGRLLTAAQAKSALPVVSDVPGTGWTAQPTPPDSGDATVTPASCSPVMNELSTDFSGYESKLAAKESVTFANKAAGETELLFEVASWTNEADSGLPLAAADLVKNCKTFNATEEGTTLQITAEPLTPLPIGDEQVAVRLTASFQGAAIHLIVFEARIGHNLVSMVQTNSDGTDHSADYKPILDGIVKHLSAA